MGRRPLLSIKRLRTVSASDCTIKTHCIDSRGRDGGQRHGKAGGHDGATDAVYQGFF